uniref:15-hydroxyprostaglandin dehydrogenase [NAD(+)]-like isoform X2 n=1 Tax=Diabrotica virgifera virgifera TaxID=50390 RepID=A0A6P7F0F5_DIAVI
MAFQITNKVAMVTGGAGGIGLAIVKKLLEKNVKGVSVVDINENIGQNAVKMLKEEFGPKVIFIKTDISNYNSFENAFQISLEHFKNVDVLFNNAGIHDDMDYSKEIDVNVKGTINGVILGIEKYLKYHKSGEEGVIVNTSSIAGLEKTLLPTYSATKFAVNGITVNWGTRLHYDDSKVRVFGICPCSKLSQNIHKIQRSTFLIYVIVHMRHLPSLVTSK